MISHIYWQCLFCHVNAKINDHFFGDKKNVLSFVDSQILYCRMSLDERREKISNNVQYLMELIANINVQDHEGIESTCFHRIGDLMAILEGFHLHAW